MFAAGMFMMPLQLMGIDLAFIPGDLGDTRFNNYVLEHGYKWLSGQVDSFWNAPFFYPTERTISFSDNHLGTLPFYALFRAFGADRETAFQLWFLVIFTLNYFSCAWALKKLKINAVGVAAGAFLFTFSLPILGQISHCQLLPRFMIPLAFYFALRFFENNSIKAFSLMCFSAILQLYCTIYMGTFLILGILTFLAAYLTANGNLRKTAHRIFWGSPKYFVVRISCLLISAAILAPLLYPYYLTSLEYGLKPWEEIASMLPRLSSYLFPATGSLSWGWLSIIGSSLPMENEHHLFPGAMAMLTLIVMPFLYRRYRNDPLAKLGMWCVLAVAGLVFLTLYIKYYPPYKLLYSVPGIGAVRAVTRITLMTLFPLAVILGVVITMLSRSMKQFIPSFTSTLISFIILSALIADNSFLRIENQAYSKTESQERLSRIAGAVLKEGVKPRVFVYMPDNEKIPFYMMHLDAMLASQDMNIATVNGYSSLHPRGLIYDKFSECETLYYWKAFSGRRHAHDHKYDGLFDSLKIVGRNDCAHKPYSYSFSDAPLPDSAFRAGITSSRSTIEIRRGSAFALPVILKNDGNVRWPALTDHKDGKYLIQFAYRIVNTGMKADSDFTNRIPLPYDLAPGESYTFKFRVSAPYERGDYYLEFDAVQECVSWFRHKGSSPFYIRMIVL
jgi:hypothetical protein